MEKQIKIIFFFLLLNLYFIQIALSINEKDKCTVSGYVKDAKNGEALIGATVFINEIQTAGITTNAYGFYSLTIARGNYTIIAQFVGYTPITQTLKLDQNKKIDFELSEKVTELNEVIVTSTRQKQNVEKPEMGVNNLSIKEIKSIPALFGERDVLKSIQLLPGVLPAGEGNSGFFVRGGSADQNLILLDEATVYNASHLLGFFSVFNPDAVKDVTLYKGSMPAEYGGRLSSVLAMTMNDGNSKEYHVNGGIGLIASRLTVEGPIDNNGSFIISGRRTYADIIAHGLYDIHILKDTSLKSATLYFYDLNAKANYRITDKDRVYLSGYFGKDVLGILQGGINWGNTTATLRWNHLFSDKLFSNTSLVYSNYNYTINNGDSRNTINIVSQIQDWNLKEDFQLFPNERNQVKFGFNSIHHTFIPGTVEDTSSNITRPTLPHKYGWENAIYFSHEIKMTPKINFIYGLRLSMFTLMGPGTFYTYDNEQNIIDSATFKSNQVAKNYFEPEPRAAVTYILDDVSSVKASIARNTQYLHLLSNSTVGLPTDLWIPSSNNVKPELATQYSVGYFRNFFENKYEFSTELYYKNMYNQIDYIPGATLNFNANVESQLIYGKGRAYGMELFLNKKTGRLTGWVSYTLSRSERSFPDANSGNWYPAKQDRTHDVSIVGIYDISKKWNLAATWVYYYGNAVTFPSGKYDVGGYVANYYTSRNGYRMPNYQRLDLAATYNCDKKGRYESSWTFSIYNAYNYDNPFIITFGPGKTNPNITVATETTLFRFIPSITYNFKF